MTILHVAIWALLSAKFETCCPSHAIVTIGLIGVIEAQRGVPLAALQSS